MMVPLICQMVVKPGDSPVIRGVATGNARPSAVAKPFSKPPMNWSTPPPAIQQMLPADEAIIMCTFDPLCSIIFTDKNPLSAILQQLWIVTGNPDSSVVSLVPGQTSSMAQDLYCSIPNGGARAWHGPRLYARLYKGNYYLWCDASTTPGATNNIAVSCFTGQAAGDTTLVTIYRLNEGDEIVALSTRVVGVIAPGANITVFNLPVPDYYRVVLTADDENTTNPLTYQVINNATSEILVHLALPDLTEREMNKVQGCRVLGSAVHAINLVNDNNATGSWVGDQPDSSIMYTAFLRGASGANGFQKLAGQRGNALMELKKYNPYGFVTPEDMDDFQFNHLFSFSSQSQVTNVINKPFTEYPYVIFYLKSGGTTITADASRNIQLEFFQAVEYTTDGIWPDVGISPATQDDWEAAVKVLASIENVTHNPGFKEIMATIGKYARLSAPVLSLLGPYGKAASIAVGGIGEGLGMVFPGKNRTKKTARQGDIEEGDLVPISGTKKARGLAQGE